MLTFNVNWLAILVCAFVNMAIGAVWYGPLFGKPWMEALGIKPEEASSSEMGKAYAVAVLNSLLMAFILANVITLTSTMGFGGGVLLGLMMWVGFTGFTFGVNHAFEGRSLQLWAINAGLFLVSLLVMGAILGVWQ